MNGWALEGFRQTYQTFGISHDRVYNESEHYDGGKDIVRKAFDDGLVEKDKDKNLTINLEEHKLGKKILLRADGTSVYMTQDINLARLKEKDFQMDKSIYVVGSEQILHFRQLFRILEILGVCRGDLYHLAHGMVYLPSGRMKSREGKVVDADDLAAEMVKAAECEIRKRGSADGQEAAERAAAIGMGALRFFILKYDPLKDFTFNPEESISFEGETGPYVQYAHARICSIIRKHSGGVPENADPGLLTTGEEQDLIRLMAKFPLKVGEAAAHYKPLIICRYLLDLSQSFNNFYHKHPILTADGETASSRLALIDAVRQVLRNGLRLLSMEAPERM